jgi:predicted solute-binding protein
LPPVSAPKLRVCAVSFLNTTPLVWGMLHGPQQGLFDLEFRVPAGCAEQVASGAAAIGIVPSIELTRQNLDIVPGAGIATHGAVRSILLIAKCPAGEVRTLAADSSSRTSVQLARVVLERKYGTVVETIPHPPDLRAMLRIADAALLIGDPALRLDPDRLPFRVYDLGAEWVEMTGLPMVFAVWAGRPGVATVQIEEAFRGSWEYGRAHMDEIVAAESSSRGFPPGMVRTYLTCHIVHQLGPREYQGMNLFLEYARGKTAAHPGI